MPKRELPKEEQNVDLLNNLSRLNRNKELMDEMSRNKNK